MDKLLNVIGASGSSCGGCHSTDVELVDQPEQEQGTSSS